MVKALLLGLLAVIMCGTACAAPAPQPAQETPPPPPVPLEEDPAARSERSTNLSVAGSSRKIQMFIKNRLLQILPDGTVNGTTDSISAYTILQRSTIGVGQMKIQGVATCQYLCMDSCGMLYGSREFGDECIFNETIEQHHYNTYLSSKYSNANRTMYLALNRMGQPKKVMLRAHQQLGKKSSYTRVLTRTVDPEQADYHVRHHAHLCAEKQSSSAAGHQIDPPRCHKRKKRKKKRKCHPDGTTQSELEYHNHTRHDPESQHLPQSLKRTHVNQHKLVKKCNGEDSECDLNRDVRQRDPVTTKNHKTKNAVITPVNDKVHSVTKKKKLKKRKKKNKLCVNRGVQAVSTTTEIFESSTNLAYTTEEDYLESTTHLDWDDATAVPELHNAVSIAQATSSPD